MSILVTGAGGFVGTHLVEHLKKENDVVSMIHNPINSYWQVDALNRTVIVSCDVRDIVSLRRIIARYEVEQVYHTAALAKVKTAYKDPVSVYDVNVMGTIALLEACGALGVDRVLVMNTDKVYGEGLLLDEDVPFTHSEPYATSKACQGLIVRSCVETYDMDIVMPHSCNIYGYDPYSNRIVPNTVIKCLTGQSPLIFTNDDSIREYIYIDDLLNALTTLMNSDRVGSHNIVTGDVMNQREVVLEILKHFPDLEAKYMEVDLPPQIEKESLASTRWDWEPEHTFEEGIAKTIQSFKDYDIDWNWREHIK